MLRASVMLGNAIERCKRLRYAQEYAIRQRTKIKVCLEVNFSLRALPADVLVAIIRPLTFIFSVWSKNFATENYTIYMKKNQEQTAEIHTILQFHRGTRLKTHKFHMKRA